MTGKLCGLLTVVSHAGSLKTGNGRNSTAVWDCLCQCGNRLTVVGWALRSGHTQSCGCARVQPTMARKTRRYLVVVGECVERDA
jgi:hypothetical protein